jgi:hypothetical protein
VFVITEDIFGASGVQIGQGATAVTDRQHFGCQPPLRFIALNPLKPFFGCLSDGSRNTFTGDGRKLADDLFSVRVFDVQRHLGTWAEFIRL